MAKNMTKLKTNENEYVQEQLLLEMEKFNKTLYSSQIPENAFQHHDPCSPFLSYDNVPKLDKEQQNM